MLENNILIIAVKIPINFAKSKITPGQLIWPAEQGWGGQTFKSRKALRKFKIPYSKRKFTQSPHVNA